MRYLTSSGNFQADGDSNPTTYNPEVEMRRNAAFTSKVCRSLIGEERLWFYKASERPGQSLTWTSTTEKFSLLFTPIPKCGWTTWQILFYTDAGKLDNIKREQRWAWDNDYHDVDIQKTVIQDAKYDNYKDRLLFVRDPYERLVSAYNDKALHADGLYTKRYHIPCGWLNLSHNYTLSFSQFVSCVIAKAEEQRKDPAKIDSRHAAVALDIHWRPQSHLSLPCRLHYNLIGKYDRFSENSEFMINRLRLNATLSRNNHKRKGEKSLHLWYQQLNPKLIEKLQDLYKYDFILFGFDSNPPGKRDVK